MTKNREAKEACDCVFCNSKCPGCGSTEIKVDFTVQYRFTNVMQDRIFVSIGDSQVHLQCQECDFDSLYGGDLLNVVDGGKKDVRLQRLYGALHSHIASTTMADIEFDQHGKIVTHNFEVAGFIFPKEKEG